MEVTMPKGEFTYECDQCGRPLVQGIEKDSHVFCNGDCLRRYYAKYPQAHSVTANTSASKTENRGSNPRGPANIPSEAIEHQAVTFLAKTLKADVDDPDFPRWKKKAEDLFTRYHKLKVLMTKPLGEGWKDEDQSSVDGWLDLIERKISAAEDILGLTPDKLP
jgi:uncharacterized Zn finger protein (UPF0148 family)